VKEAAETTIADKKNSTQIPATTIDQKEQESLPTKRRRENTRAISLLHAYKNSAARKLVPFDDILEKGQSQRGQRRMSPSMTLS
jgi:hypothetical protein